MSMNFVVNYAYKVLGADTKPEDERYGFGKVTVNTDKVPETPEELKEVARTIGLECGPYEMVAIQTIEPLDKLIESGDVVIEGTIVDSE